VDTYALGSFTVLNNGENVVPRAAKPRTLLALLRSSDGNVVSSSVIISELWDDRPPRTAATTVHTYVMQLRRLIGAARVSGTERVDPKDVLRRDGSGYLLVPGDGHYDVAEYDRLASEGHKAAQANDCLTAHRRLSAALNLWRGPAFSDVQSGPRLSAEVTRLEESRKMLLERRIEIDLRLGWHHQVLGELAGLTTEHPTHEGLQALYVIALYRCGQRARALAQCDELRTRMADEFGLDLLPAMAALRQAILVNDPALDDDALWPQFVRRSTEPQARHVGVLP